MNEKKFKPKKIVFVFCVYVFFPRLSIAHFEFSP